VNQHDRIVDFGVQGLGMQVQVDEVDQRPARRLCEPSWLSASIMSPLLSSFGS
jgi:hypothetical protein